MPNIPVKHGFVYDANISCNINYNEALVNREKIKKHRELDILMANQEHSNIVIEATKSNFESLKSFYDKNQNQINCDGIITALPNIAISCYVADCVPVFLYTPDVKLVAIIHSGSKSTFSGINENAIDKLQKIGASVESLHVAIGPSISINSYEVGEDFYQKFIDNDSSSKQFFKHSNNSI